MGRRTVEELVRLHEDGLRPREIAAKLGKSGSYVYSTLYRLRRSGVLPKFERRIPSNPDEMCPVSFTLTARDAGRLRDYASGLGVTVSEAMRDIVICRLDESDV